MNNYVKDNYVINLIQTVTHHQLPTHQQQAALQAAMMNPAALQAMIQNQNPQLLHQLQHQQLQQLQQLHQQNLRLAGTANFSKSVGVKAWA